MHVIIERHSKGFIDSRYRWPTMGKWTIAGHTLWTLEDPWNNNAPGNSCVPDAVYDLVPHSTDAHPDTWAMVNPALNVWHMPDDIPTDKKPVGRFACLFGHTGNWEDDVKGCILHGFYPAIFTDPHDNRPELAVANSSAAMKIIRNALVPGTTGHTVLIRSAFGCHLSE